MRIKRFLNLLGISTHLKGSIHTLSLSHQTITQKTVFIALKGVYHDGNDYITPDFLNQVGLVLSDRKSNHPKVIYIQNLKYRLDEIVAILYPKILKNVEVMGIVGTCGKTTTATMLYQILKADQKNVMYFGTNQIFYEDKKITTNNTTLNAIEFIQQFLSSKYKPQYLILEVSSHAILENRVNFLHFSSLIFTNFSQDHLDYHLNMENYFEVKKAIFKSLAKNKLAIINIEDKKAYTLISQTNANIICYGLKKGKYTLKDYARENTYEYNLYNMLAAYSMAKALHIDEFIIKNTLDHYQFEYGRSQIVYQDDFTIIVDYAHTPSSLESLLKANKKICQNKLRIVFGCGGNRDQDKRKIMGKIAQKYADFIYLTNDNPRDEKPSQIIQDIKVGCKSAKVILNRKEAIQTCIKQAQSGDIVLIVGKGIEDYQIIQNQKIPFSDIECIKECVKQNE